MITFTTDVGAESVVEDDSYLIKLSLGLSVCSANMF